jgi:hypothetical protein
MKPDNIFDCPSHIPRPRINEIPPHVKLRNSQAQSTQYRTRKGLSKVTLPPPPWEKHPTKS